MSEEPPAPYPKPATPLCFKEAVRKILTEPDYANFIHHLVMESRDENLETATLAADELAEYFQIQPDELVRLNLPPETADQSKCTNPTTHFMIDFAAAKDWE